MNLGEDADSASRFDNLQAVADGSFDGFGVDAVPLGEIWLDFRNAFAKLAGRSDAVVVAVVVEANSEVDEALEEPAVWLPRGGPDFFQHFVAFEKLAAVEEVEVRARVPGFLLQERVAGSGPRRAAAQRLLPDRGLIGAPQEPAGWPQSRSV